MTRAQGQASKSPRAIKRAGVLMRVMIVCLVAGFAAVTSAPALAAAPTAAMAEGSHAATPGLQQSAEGAGGAGLPTQLPDLTSRDNLGPALQMLILLTVVSLAPAVLVLCTSFTRIIIVLSLLRQALGTQNLPPNQVLAGLSLFMTCIVMAPTWGQINEEAIRPYLNNELTQQQALAKGVLPLRNFMIAQIEAAENSGTAYMLLEYSRQPIPEGREPTWNDVSTATLIPAFVLSELKVAFLMGFKLYLPFLVIDLVISIVLTSMGMLMLPPVLVSLPFKLLLFVLVDGWTLVAAGLIGSFVITSG